MADGVFILGATGPTGVLLTQELCAQSKVVVVMIRSEARRAEFEGYGARVLIGDVMNRDEVFHAASDASSDCKMVVNLVGGSPMTKPDDWPDHEGNVNAIDAVKEAGFERFIFVTSVGTGSSMKFVPPDAFVIPLLKLKTLAEEHLHASGMRWTILKPGGLNHKESIRSPNLLVTESDAVRGLIDREQLAEVIVTTINDDSGASIGKELYIVADRIEILEGEAQPFVFGSA